MGRPCRDARRAGWHVAGRGVAGRLSRTFQRPYRRAANKPHAYAQNPSNGLRSHSVYDGSSDPWRSAFLSVPRCQSALRGIGN